MEQLFYVLIYKDEAGYYADPQVCIDQKQMVKIMNGHCDQYIGAFPIKVSENKGREEGVEKMIKDSKTEDCQTYEVRVWDNGYRLWFQNGKLNRTDGPAEEYSNGDKVWYQNGRLHRTDGPAIEHANGDKFWCQNDKPHRTDGPAIEHADGRRFWFIEGAEYLEADFIDRVKKLNQPSYEGKVIEMDGKKYKLTEVK